MTHQPPNSSQECLLYVHAAGYAALLPTPPPPYLQNFSPAKMYVFLFLLQLKAASTRSTSGGSPRLVSGLGYPGSRVLAEYTQYSFPGVEAKGVLVTGAEMPQASLFLPSSVAVLNRETSSCSLQIRSPDQSPHRQFYNCLENVPGQGGEWGMSPALARLTKPGPLSATPAMKRYLSLICTKMPWGASTALTLTHDGSGLEEMGSQTGEHAPTGLVEPSAPPGSCPCAPSSDRAGTLTVLLLSHSPYWSPHNSLPFCFPN